MDDDEGILHIAPVPAEPTHAPVCTIARVASRNRMSQVLALTYLAPDIQLEVIALEAIDGVEPANHGEVAVRERGAAAQLERATRSVASADCTSWSLNRCRAKRLRPDCQMPTRRAWYEYGLHRVSGSAS